MDFSLGPLLDPQRCYEYLVSVFHPQGLICPHGHGLEEAFVHKKDRWPILDYRCRTCGRCFNVFTGTVLEDTKHNAVGVVQMLRGFAQGVPTAQLAREMGVDRKWLLVWRHKIQALAAERRERSALADRVVEADEMYQNAGEKKHAAPGPRRPAASARQQDARARHVGQRPPAGERRGRTRRRGSALEGAAS
jgi:transposase-like protein